MGNCLMKQEGATAQMVAMSKVHAPVATPYTEPVAAPYTEPVVTHVEVPVEVLVAAPVSAPVAAPVVAPVAAPVVAPVVTPVAAPVVTPVAAPTYVRERSYSSDSYDSGNNCDCWDCHCNGCRNHHTVCTCGQVRARSNSSRSIAYSDWSDD